MIKQTTSWSDFYIWRNNKSYYNHVRDRYNPFIQLLIKEIIKTKATNVAEAGCGIGNITRALIAKLPYKVYSVIDNDEQMLNMAIGNLSHLQDGIEFIQQDITKTPVVADLIHSHGVLEHFSDEDIRKIISLQRGKTLLHYVPSSKYRKPSFGDERLMSARKWKKICRPDEIIEFNNGYDLILKWNK